MPYVYAISDPHGCLDVLEQALRAVDLDDPDNLLVLLGDYVPHRPAYGDDAEFGTLCERSLAYVKDLCEAHPGRVVALKGNHELDLAEDVRAGAVHIDRGLARWAARLPLFHETDNQIFVHAGIDEEAGDLWKWGTDEYMLCCKFPASTGRFYKDIVAGHVGTRALRNGFDASVDVFWDGESHYYIDGTTEQSGVIPVLIYDTHTGKYSSRIATADGVGPRNPVLPETPAP